MICPKKCRDMKGEYEMSEINPDDWDEYEKTG